MRRRSVLAAAGAALLSACSPARAPKPRQGAPKPVRHRYGSAPQQYADLYLPHTRAPHRTVVVIHGGFWQDVYALDLGAAISADLADRGWAAWNIEYRRLGDGGGWPATFEDVAAAVDHLARLDVPTEGVVALGHSAGGHLAAWAASRHGDTPGGAPRVRVAAVVPQAGVLDLALAATTRLGGTAAVDLLGGLPREVPRRYALADPIERLPLGVPVRCVHGTADTTVPLSQSRRFVAAARRAGDDAALVEVPGDHFALIDPTSRAWATTVDVLSRLPR